MIKNFKIYVQWFVLLLYYEAIAECFRPHKTYTVNFLNWLQKRTPWYANSQKKKFKTMFSKPKKNFMRKVKVFYRIWRHYAVMIFLWIFLVTYEWVFELWQVYLNVHVKQLTDTVGFNQAQNGKRLVKSLRLCIRILTTNLAAFALLEVVGTTQY